jgi:hypothetical protein|tara:strand:- start:1296 stop:1547 length:252 start_codon:yes stop_codon:yes gene_type:complete|eukprot:31176-Pelagococcus_subviridis.AAC.16
MSALHLHASASLRGAPVIAPRAARRANGAPPARRGSPIARVARSTSARDHVETSSVVAHHLVAPFSYSHWFPYDRVGVVNADP